MKRLTALGLSLVLILAAAGCGKAEQNRQDSAAILPETADSQSQVPEDDSPANTASGSAAPGDPITDTDPPALTLPTLRDLADRYGEALSWADFAPYFSEDIGSGLYLFTTPWTGRITC